MQDRYTSTEPLIPDWAAPVYLVVSVVTASIYLGVDIFVAAMPGLAVLKALGIVLLAAFALFRGAFGLTLALLLSACGDFALGVRPPQTEAGIAFFAGAHLVYVALFGLAITRHGLRKDGLVLVAALAAYGAAMWVWLNGGMGELRLMASLYLGLILIMAGLAALVNGPRLIVGGALLFVLSDSILAAGWFRGLDVSIGFVDLDGAAVWISYYLAQACLAVGIVRLRRQPTGAPPQATAAG